MAYGYVSHHQRKEEKISTDYYLLSISSKSDDLTFTLYHIYPSRGVSPHHPSFLLQLPSTHLLLSASSMASFLPFLLLSLLFHIPLPHAFLLPVSKDPSSLHYLTSLSYGTPLVPTLLVLDLGAPSLWIDCSSRDFPSSSLRTLPLRSIQCLMAQTETHHIETHTTRLPDESQPCQIFPQNTITGKIPREGELVQDVVVLQSIESVHRVLFTCSPTQQLNGLALGAKGMVGLGTARSSLSSQIFDSLNTQRKITLCLSSSTGVLSFGGNSYVSQPGGEIFRSLTFTPLVANQKGYFINVKSIKISGRRLSLSLPKGQVGNGRTQLSSIVPYTSMDSSIYETFKKAYLEAAIAMNITRVASVAPFELCFSSKGLSHDVPVIDFVLQSEMVKWRIHGRNSMVRLSSEVMCLAFVDGGLNPENPIVIGGYQMEDVIVQFDLDTSMVGFSSLLMRDSSCSDFKFGYIPTESV